MADSVRTADGRYPQEWCDRHKDKLARLATIGYSAMGAKQAVESGRYDKIWTPAHEEQYRLALADAKAKADAKARKSAAVPPAPVQPVAADTTKPE